MGAFWAPFWSSWEPKLAPSSLQDGSCDAIFDKKLIFKKTKENQWFFNLFAPLDGAENAPRSTQDAPKTVLKSYFFDVQNYDRFWSVLGSILGAFWEAFWLTKGYQKSTKFMSPSKGAPQEAPRGLQEGPKRPQERPKRP